MMTRATIESTDLDYIYNNAFKALKTLSGSRLLITGGGGFLGYYLSKIICFWNKHHTVPISLTLIDTLTQGTPHWINTLDRHVSLHKLDVNNLLSKDIIQHEFIMHAASHASPSFYRQYPLQTIKANVFGLHHLLENLSENSRSQGILFFSSSEIYGNPEPKAIPTPETYPGSVSCTGPRACYDESKRFGETLCVNYCNTYHLPIKIVRPFNHYGPGLHLNDKRVIPDFAKNILNQQNITLFSKGDSTRTFCYVADAIVGFLKVLVFGKAGDAYNIGVDSPELTIHQLATKMASIAQAHFDYQGRVTFATHDDKHYLTDNPERRCPDITKAQSELDYHPKITLEEGLTRTLLWYQSQMVTQ